MASFLKPAVSKQGAAESSAPVDRASALDSITRLDQERPGTLQRVLQQVRARAVPPAPGPHACSGAAF
jgi:hypothetical protein